MREFCQRIPTGGPTLTTFFFFCFLVHRGERVSDLHRPASETPFKYSLGSFVYAQADLRLCLSHIVGNLMHWLI